jgi:hypothetical protein
MRLIAVFMRRRVCNAIGNEVVGFIIRVARNRRRFFGKPQNDRGVLRADKSGQNDRGDFPKGETLCGVRG